MILLTSASLPGQHALEIAMNIGGLALTSLGFFVAISLGFVGWVLTSDYVLSRRWCSALRLILGCCYVISAGSIAWGCYGLFIRAGGALSHANALFCGNETLSKDKALRLLFDTDCATATGATVTSAAPLAGVALSATMVLALYVIVFHRKGAAA
ncbi:MAG: hypothetical protein AAGD47_06095 [Pseudomonadota bacterium]